MIPIQIITTSWQVHQRELTHIRAKVFMEEQGVTTADEWDGLDESATHFLVQNKSGDFIGCARLLTEQATNSAQFHIGRVAILKPFRGQGLGFTLMRFIIDYCQTHAPCNSIYLHAQCERQGFYETLGFSAEGDIFMDAGIPHISMWYSTTEE